VNPNPTVITDPVDPEVVVNPEDNNNTNPTNPSNTDVTYHKVSSGETLGTIASRYGMSVSDLQRLNGLSSTKIYVGQRLKVKGGSNNGGNDNNVTPTPPPASKQYYSVRAGD